MHSKIYAGIKRIQVGLSGKKIHFALLKMETWFGPNLSLPFLYISGGGRHPLRGETEGVTSQEEWIELEGL